MLVIQLIVIQIVTFVALVFVLRKIMYSASYMETKRLQKLNAENVKRAQELSVKVREVEKECQEKLGVCEVETKRLKNQAQEEIERLKQEALKKAKQESERMVSQALNVKDKIRQELEAQMLDKAVDCSYKLIASTLNVKNQKLLHEGLLDDVLGDLSGIKPVNIEIKAATAQLDTPYEIDESRKEKISSMLSQKFGKKIVLEEKINPEVIAGITIKLGSLIIDGSLSAKLKEAAEAMKKE